MSRFLERRETAENESARDIELTKLVHECSRLIEREVSTLAALVDQFLPIGPFPNRQAIATNANTIVHEAVEVFSGRLDGITLRATLADAPAGSRGCCASVVVDLIDNAAEAGELELPEILISTCANPDADGRDLRV